MTGLSWLSANGDLEMDENVPVSGALGSVQFFGAKLYSNVEKYSPFGSLTGKKGYMEIAVRITLLEPSPPSLVFFLIDKRRGKVYGYFRPIVEFDVEVGSESDSFHSGTY